jgi:hypothetical protein
MRGGCTQAPDLHRLHAQRPLAPKRVRALTVRSSAASHGSACSRHGHRQFAQRQRRRRAQNTLHRALLNLLAARHRRSRSSRGSCGAIFRSAAFRQWWRRAPNEYHLYFRPSRSWRDNRVSLDRYATRLNAAPASIGWLTGGGRHLSDARLSRCAARRGAGELAYEVG